MLTDSNRLELISMVFNDLYNRNCVRYDKDGDFLIKLRDIQLYSCVIFKANDYQVKVNDYQVNDTRRYYSYPFSKIFYCIDYYIGYVQYKTPAGWVHYPVKQTVDILDNFIIESAMDYIRKIKGTLTIETITEIDPIYKPPNYFWWQDNGC